MRTFAVYTLARLGLFAAAWAVVCLVAVGLAGVSWSSVTALWTALLGLVISAIVSLIVLRGLRQRFADSVEARAGRMVGRVERQRRERDVD